MHKQHRQASYRLAQTCTTVLVLGEATRTGLSCLASSAGHFSRSVPCVLLPLLLLAIPLTCITVLPADYNATTPIYPEVTAAMQPFTSQHFGNPSSVHTYGLATRAAVDKARQQVAALINCWADELAFTSCGTEADNWAIWGSVMARKDTVEGTPHVVTSAVEHPAVTKCLQQLQQLVSTVSGSSRGVIGCRSSHSRQ